LHTTRLRHAATALDHCVDIPGVAIGAAHAIAGVGPKVGEWPLIPGHMGFHNWEYVTRAAAR